MLSISIYNKKLVSMSLILLVATVILSATGCSTTHEFKPTASVIVGAHKSLWYFLLQVIARLSYCKI